MSSQSLHRLCAMAGVILCALPLVGCGEQTVSSRAEAEALVASGKASEENVIVKQPDGSEERLSDILRPEREKKWADEAKAAEEKKKQEEKERQEYLAKETTGEKILRVGGNAVDAAKKTVDYFANGQTQLYEASPSGTPVQLFKVGNDSKVSNGGSPTPILLDQPSYITEWWTYHWNNGVSKEAGTITVKSDDGKTYGPWHAILVNGVYWKAEPNVTLPAGSYTVIDSDPSTWSQNSGSSGHGMTWAMGWSR